FLHGGIERIQGHAQGRLVIAAAPRADDAGQSPTRGGAVAALLERARRHANHAEVLGYV
ncbi:methionine ABC transporter ATP-binding protein, partial [Burkholderia territorii]